ncbi:MAG TPA: lycopene cyclase domain-containing protein [Jatrophihabitans sp.]|nr:lycopene cyclase domain-containing protein [Jatrophihabitans sp.]
MTYTGAALLGVLAALLLDLAVLRTSLVRRRAFWAAYAIVLFFQLLVNGTLTGLRIVRYDRSTIIGWRVAYAPVEDLLFGFALVLVTLSLWVAAGRRAARRPRPAGRPTRPSPAGRGRRARAR